jgi:hypothetical protein
MKTPDILKRIGKRVYDGMKKHPMITATITAVGTAILSDQLINYIFDYSFFDSIYNTAQTFDVSHGYAKAEHGSGENYSVVIENISKDNHLNPEELSILKENGNTVIEQGEVSLPNYMEGDTFTAGATSETAGNRLGSAIEPASNEDIFIVNNTETSTILDGSSIASKIAVLTNAYHVFNETLSRLRSSQTTKEDIASNVPAKKVRVIRTYELGPDGYFSVKQN